jgi:hypothetical protein
VTLTPDGPLSRGQVSLSCRESAVLGAGEDLACDAPVDHVEDRFEVVRAPILRSDCQVFCGLVKLCSVVVRAGGVRFVREGAAGGGMTRGLAGRVVPLFRSVSRRQSYPGCRRDFIEA